MKKKKHNFLEYLVWIVSDTGKWRVIEIDSNFFLVKTKKKRNGKNARTHTHTYNLYTTYTTFKHSATN